MTSLPASLSSLPVQLTQRETLLALFDNYTWSRHLEGDHFDHSDHSVAWKHPQANVFVTLTVSLIMKVKMGEKMLLKFIFNLLLLGRESSLMVKNLKFVFSSSCQRWPSPCLSPVELLYLRSSSVSEFTTWLLGHV